jgi:hypothetical protein
MTPFIVKLPPLKLTAKEELLIIAIFEEMRGAAGPKTLIPE